MSWKPARLPKFQVYRGDGKHTATWSMTYEAVNARDAVRQDNERNAKMFRTLKPLPVVAVYFLAEVPKSDWR